MAAHGPQQVPDVGRQAGDVIAGLRGDLRALSPLGLDPDQAVQVGPGPVGVHRPNVFRCAAHPAATGLDTAAGFVHGLVEVMVAAFEGLRLFDGEGLDHRLVQLRLLPLSVSTQSATGARIVCAIRFRQPMATMVTMPPSITGISSSAGMAVPALDGSSTRHSEPCCTRRLLQSAPRSVRYRRTNVEGTRPVHGGYRHADPLLS